MSQTKPQIVICGSVAIDRIMDFGGRYMDVIQPDKMHTLSLSVTIDKLEDSRGGCGANIALCLAQLGEEPVLLGSVGNDAKEYINELGKAGVTTSNIHFSALPTASFNVITDSDDNQVGGFYQGAMNDSDSLSFLPWQGKDAVGVIAPGNSITMNRLVEECRTSGLPIFYDPGQQLADPVLDPKAGVSAAEVLLLNDYELGTLSKRIGQSPEEIKQQVPVVVTTFGRSGSIIEGDRVSQPIKIGIARAEPADPTGAGDAYRAGFLYGYVRDWDLKKCGQLGATVASFIIEHHGTQQSFTKDEVAARYQVNFNEEIMLDG